MMTRISLNCRSVERPVGHDFHATETGERYTLSEPAHRTVFDRILAVNHHRHLEEGNDGLHEKRTELTSRTQSKPDTDVPKAESKPSPQLDLL